jgi:transposase InsO family protein
MSLGQALAHYSAQMEMVLGLKFPPRKFMRRLFGWFAKRRLLNEKPLHRNVPTDEAFVVNDERNLGLERERLRVLLDRFVASGPAACTKHPHSFLGPMTPVEWATLMYKHLDHHLRQFGV